jgi:Carboxypeptidase regulatory-like domain
MKAALALALVAASAAAQDAKHASMQGVVVNALTGEPVSKAVVTVLSLKHTSDTAQSATTDRQGAFEIQGITPGICHISAAKPGYFGDAPKLKVAGSDDEVEGLIITLGAGEKLDSVRVKLTPLGVVTGRVSDEDGDPLRRAEVTLKRVVWPAGSRNSDGARVETNDLGEFRAADLRPGRYYVSFWYESRAPRLAGKAKNEETYRSLYFPGVPRIEDAVPVEVVAGSVRAGVDVRLSKAGTFRVSGELRGVRAASAEEVTLSLTGPLQFREGHTSPTNTFEFERVLPGHYTLIAQVDTWYAKVPLDVTDRNISNLVVTLARRFPIKARVIWDGDAPANPSQPAIHVEPIPPGSLGTFEDAKRNADGSLTIPDMLPWKMSIQIDGLSDQDYLKSIRYGDVTVDDGTFDVVAGVDLDIKLRTGAASIEGTVTQEDKPRAAATVVLIHTKYRSWAAFSRVTTSDQNGHFSMHGVAPGNYQLYAFDAIEDGGWFDPDFDSKFAPRSVPLKVEEKGTVTTNLTLITH